MTNKDEDNELLFIILICVYILLFGKGAHSQPRQPNNDSLLIKTTTLPQLNPEITRQPIAYNLIGKRVNFRKPVPGIYIIDDHGKKKRVIIQ